MSALLELVVCALAAGGSTAAGLAVIPRISDMIRGRQEARDNPHEPDITPSPEGSPASLADTLVDVAEAPGETASELRRPARAA